MSALIAITIYPCNVYRQFAKILSTGRPHVVHGLSTRVEWTAIVLILHDLATNCCPISSDFQKNAPHVWLSLRSDTETPYHNINVMSSFFCRETDYAEAPFFSPIFASIVSKTSLRSSSLVSMTTASAAIVSGESSRETSRSSRSLISASVFS